LDTTPLSEVMTSSPHTQTMTSTMAFCLTMMSEGGYRHIPIVDDDDIPIGLVSVKDIVDYIVGQLQLDLGTIAHGESASAHSRV
ncbi:MAG: CBS domain-containing protein, partial [Bdellovibrionales bacterium]|nr:CBS domain-containing protein [Bdellovibrionales bacterium]